MDNKYVFISYSSVNKAIADATCHILEECGIPCWIAPRNIVPGKTWAGNIVQAIRDCAIMVLIYSEDSNNSSQVANEVDRAFNNRKIIIPFMVDETPMNDDFDYYLSRKHWLVAYPDYKEKLMPLVEAVALNLGVEVHRPQEAATAEPQPAATEPEPQTNPAFEAAIANAREAIGRYDLDAAFAELLRPALSDHAEAQFLTDTLVTTYERMHKLDPYRFSFVKEKADEGNAYAQYLMSRYHACIKRDDAEILRYARLCAAQDKAYGYHALARCYEFGTGVDIDLCRAHELLDKAVAMDFAPAIIRLAKDHLYGWTQTRNPRRAFSLLKRCMAHNLPESFCLMGDMYIEGDGVETDVERAMELYRKSIELGYIEGYQSLAIGYMLDYTTMQYNDDEKIQKGISVLRKGVNLGVMSCLSFLAACYDDGLGVPQKPDQALRWYKKAALAGDRNSYANVGKKIYYGEGCQADEPEAWRWFARGAELDNGASHYYLGIMCLDGYGQEGKAEADCIPYFERSIFLGGAGADLSALKLYNIFRTRSLEQNPLMRDEEDSCKEYDWAPKDNARALRYLKDTADKNLDSETPFKYGAILCTEGNGFTDEFEGMKFLKRALEKGEARAAVMLAQIYERGDLVDKDLEQAREYYQLAADKDCGDGHRGLADMLSNQIATDNDTTAPEAKKMTVHEIYEHVHKADELGCKELTPLYNTLITFMLNEDLLSSDECNEIDNMNRKYMERGDMQSLTDRGVMHQMGMILPKDIHRAMDYYKQAARLGKTTCAVNLGNLYSGSDEDLPVAQRNNVLASYWYQKDKDDTSKQHYAKLREEGYKTVCRMVDNDGNVSYNSAHYEWAFPYLQDTVFAKDNDASYRIFEWGAYGNNEISSSTPADAEFDEAPADAELRYLPKEVSDLYAAFDALRDTVMNSCGWYAPHLVKLVPQLSTDDFFPYLSAKNIHALTEFACEVWVREIQNSRHAWIEQHRPELDHLTLLSEDWSKILDLSEGCTNETIQLMLIELVELSICLDNVAGAYWQLPALNALLEHEGDGTFHLPDDFVFDFANRFYNGTDTLPRSRAIARHLYQLVPYQSGVEEKLILSSKK